MHDNRDISDGMDRFRRHSKYEWAGDEIEYEERYYEKKYKEKGFSAKRLAGELHTNTRYISAVMRMRFNMNYTSYINKLRVEEATAILADKRFADLKMEDVSFMVGFSNRQSFYTAFARVVGTTPRAYRQKALTGGQGGD